MRQLTLIKVQKEIKAKPTKNPGVLNILTKATTKAPRQKAIKET